jgi:hypothetical protein
VASERRTSHDASRCEGIRKLERPNLVAA